MGTDSPDGIAPENNAGWRTKGKIIHGFLPC